MLTCDCLVLPTKSISKTKAGSGKSFNADCNITLLFKMIKADFIICFTRSLLKEKMKRAGRGGKGKRGIGRGAESVLTSIQEEDILSFYAAHVIFIA